jgi:hypothetical protein
LVWCRHDKKVLAPRNSPAAIKKALKIESTAPSTQPDDLSYCRPQTRSWILIERMCYCYLSPDALQWMPKFLRASRVTPFHDEQLANATSEINRILVEAKAKAKSPESKLAILRMPRLGRPSMRRATATAIGLAFRLLTDWDSVD